MGTVEAIASGVLPNAFTIKKLDTYELKPGDDDEYLVCKLIWEPNIGQLSGVSHFYPRLLLRT